MGCCSAPFVGKMGQEHIAALHTPEALPGILEWMIREGYTVVPISQLILQGEYTIDHTGRQFPAGE